MRVELGLDPAGEKRWAELIELDEVPRRAKVRIQEDVLALYEKQEMHPALISIRIKDLLIANLVVEWSFGDPPNKDIEKVLNLPSKAYDLLVEAIQPYEDDLDFMKAGKAAQEKAEAERAQLSNGLADTSDSKDGSEGTSSPDTSLTRA